MTTEVIPVEKFLLEKFLLKLFPVKKALPNEVLLKKTLLEMSQSKDSFLKNILPKLLRLNRQFLILAWRAREEPSFPSAMHIMTLSFYVGALPIVHLFCFPLAAVHLLVDAIPIAVLLLDAVAPHDSSPLDHLQRICPTESPNVQLPIEPAFSEPLTYNDNSELPGNRPPAQGSSRPDIPEESHSSAIIQDIGSIGTSNVPNATGNPSEPPIKEQTDDSEKQEESHTEDEDEEVEGEEAGDEIKAFTSISPESDSTTHALFLPHQLRYVDKQQRPTFEVLAEDDPHHEQTRRAYQADQAGRLWPSINHEILGHLTISIESGHRTAGSHNARQADGEASNTKATQEVDGTGTQIVFGQSDHDENDAANSPGPVQILSTQAVGEEAAEEAAEETAKETGKENRDVSEPPRGNGERHSVSDTINGEEHALSGSDNATAVVSLPINPNAREFSSTLQRR
jgi:hypothetical protein